MKRMLIIALAFLAGIAPGAMSVQGESMTDRELWDHLQRRSEVWYKQIIQANGGAVSPGVWTSTLDRVFIRLAKASGFPPFRIKYCIVNNETFNAASLAGGQFVINAGTLKQLDTWSIAAMNADGPAGQARGVQYYREAVTAPLIAHELAHYYNRHMFNSIKKIWSYGDRNDDSLTLDMIKYSQENEFDADMTGCLLLKRAGYDPNSMILILTYANELDQQGVKEGRKQISYFASHPSAHARLAKLRTGDAAVHKWAAEMERSFEDVMFGRNLDRAAASIEKALDKYPGNIYLLKAHAVALHKRWLSTASLKQLKLKAVISMPAFRDDMVFGPTSRGRGIPGNAKYYNEAVEAYQKCVDRAFDPDFESNYAVLLCYSPDSADRAIGIARDTARRQSSWATISNLAVAMYIAGRTDEGKNIFMALTSDVDKYYSKLLGAAPNDKNVAAYIVAQRTFMQQCQLIDKSYVMKDYTPILNLALVLKYTGDDSTAKALAQAYFKKYESSSSWARYAANITGAKLPEPPKTNKLYEAKGIKVGDSMEKVLKKWGKASEIQSHEQDEYWYYKDFDAYILMEKGFVMQIVLVSPRSPKVNGKLSVGMSKEDLEKHLGGYRTQNGLYYFYGEAMEVACTYELGTVSQIYLLR